ncbi:hypothetical protein OCC_10284 [Thermococcus litoralis DSM 5473]|uniref:Uncharacterized protein n=1 Tax=Thermococcus litoralis (strain ATCC 51850 / DSM 5473 / JCM 8560 / NS-C) TaxID=523849 RepID=H3ZRA8_THELN|nr:hypothetical protein OCC_10284 [Thermococcus litoralis DSM 5473]
MKKAQAPLEYSTIVAAAYSTSFIKGNRSKRTNKGFTLSEQRSDTYQPSKSPRSMGISQNPDHLLLERAV